MDIISSQPVAMVIVAIVTCDKQHHHIIHISASSVDDVSRSVYIPTPMAPFPLGKFLRGAANYCEKSVNNNLLIGVTS